MLLGAAGAGVAGKYGGEPVEDGVEHTPGVARAVIHFREEERISLSSLHLGWANWRSAP